jgi:acetyl-CoA carboxylase carboxyltransferase component
MSWEKEVEEIARKRDLAKQLGGPKGVSRQHNQGRQTIRERIDGLVDPGGFHEMGAGAGASEYDENGEIESFSPANFIVGFGEIDGRRCVVGGEDFTLRGGSPNEAGLRKSVYAEEMATRYRTPLIRIHEGGGGSVAGAGGKTVGSPVHLPHRFKSVARALATVPVATAALGPVAGLPASRLVASHFSVMTKDTAQVLIAGPAVVKRALGEDLTKEELGSAKVHTRNGVVDNVAKDEADALAQIRRFLSYMPDNVWSAPPRLNPEDIDDNPERRDEALMSLIPRDRRKIYDPRALIAHVVDKDSFFEMTRYYGSGQITGFARMNGWVVGILANDNRFYAGAMTADGALKYRRFVEICEMFHIPVISLVDEPGFMIGSESEKAGTIRFGTAAVLAAADCIIPWASVVVRKSFGVAQGAHYGTDAHVLTWPSAEMGPLPVEGGVAVAYGLEIAAADDPDARRKELEEMLAKRQSPFPRAESFSVHEMIDPRDTRPELCRWIEWVQPIIQDQLGPRGFPYRAG